MATINVTVGADWVQIALNTDDNVLSTSRYTESVEYATTAPDTAPTVQGIALTAGMAITRDLIGPGYIWARTVSGGSAVLAVNKW